MALDADRAMNGSGGGLVADYVVLRRALGYRSAVRERSLRAFGRYLDDQGHRGPILLETSLAWATSTASTDPHNPARRLAMVRGFLRHQAGLDGATEVPPPGLLGSVGHRSPPHVYSADEIADLIAAAARLAPAAGLRPHAYATLFGLIACTGLRIEEALGLTCAAVDLTDGVLTVHGKGGRTRLVPLHPARCRRCVTTPTIETADTAGRWRRRRSSAPTAATGFAIAQPSMRSRRCAASWAGPQPAGPVNHGSMTCAMPWPSAGSRPGMKKVPTSMPTFPCWPPTSGTSRSGRCTGTCPRSLS